MWHATSWLLSNSFKIGCSLKHTSFAYSHLGANLHPGFGFIGDVISPFIIILSFFLPMLGIGIADNSALVYGCFGLSNSSAEGAFYTTFPKYITAISSEK